MCCLQAGAPGLEPRSTDPKSGVLPLHHAPKLGYFNTDFTPVPPLPSRAIFRMNWDQVKKVLPSELPPGGKFKVDHFGDLSSSFLERPCSTRPMPSSARPSLPKAPCRFASGAGMDWSVPVIGISSAGGFPGCAG